MVSRLFRDQMQVLDEIDKLKSKPKVPTSSTTAMVLDLQVEKLEGEKKALEKQVQEMRVALENRNAPDERTLRLQGVVNDLKNKLEQAMTNFALQRD